MALSVVPMMVGRIIIPRMREVVRILLPSPDRSTRPMSFRKWPKSRISGTTTTRPKKPYTTEGMPASSSVAAFRGLYTCFGQYMAMNTEVRIPIGTPKRIAPAVT